MVRITIDRLLTILEFIANRTYAIILNTLNFISESTCSDECLFVYMCFKIHLSIHWIDIYPLVLLNEYQCKQLLTLHHNCLLLLNLYWFHFTDTNFTLHTSIRNHTAKCSRHTNSPQIQNYFFFFNKCMYAYSISQVIK